MPTKNLEVKAGKLFCISRGEYSDYGVYGHFLALQDITHETFQEIVEECKTRQKVENDKEAWSAGDFYGADDRFVPELIRRGLVMDIDCYEIHTGSYGELGLS